MEISLRKAAVFRDEISAKINSFDAEHTICLQYYDEDKIDDVLRLQHAAQINAVKNLNEHTDNIEARYELRKAIGQANASSGVSDLLAEKARLSSLKLAYSNAPGDLVDPAVAVNRLKGRAIGQYPSNTLNVDSMSKEFADSMASNERISRKALVVVQDKLDNLNASVTITLSDKTVATLEAADIL